MKSLKKIAPALLALFLFTCAVLGGQTRLESLATTNPTNPDVLNSYGIELASGGDLMGAIEIWRRALEYDRRNVHLYNNIGSAMKRLGQDRHAFAWYAAALQLQPVYWTYYNIAILYRDHNQLQSLLGTRRGSASEPEVRAGKRSSESHAGRCGKRFSRNYLRRQFF